MARRQVPVPSYRLHKPSGQAVVRLDGKDHYLGLHGTPASQERYRRLVAEWLSASPAAKALASHAPSASPEHVGGSGTSRRTAADAAAPGSVTLNELIVSYLDFAKGYYVRNGTLTGEYQNIKYALRPLAELFGSVPVTSFGPRSLKVLRDEMIRRDWCRRMVNQRINTVRRMFKWGVENELVPSATLHGLQAVAPLKLGRCGVRESEPVRPVPDAFVDAVIAVSTPVVAAMIELQRLTGMRPGEVVIMRTRDIETSGKVWVYRPQEHKTQLHGKERVVYLGPACQRILRPLLKTDLDAFIFSPADSMRSTAAVRRMNRVTPLTPSQRARRPKRSAKRSPGDRYTTQTYDRAISYGCDRAFPHPLLASAVDHNGNAIKVRESQLSPQQREEIAQWKKAHRWSPNRLRHNAATFLRREFGIEAARVVLGHTTPRITEIYAERDLSRAAEIMGRVG